MDMYTSRYHFFYDEEQKEAVLVKADDLYDDQKGYGFLTEQNRK